MGAAFDPADNLIFTGEVDWCTTVQLGTGECPGQLAGGQALERRDSRDSASKTILKCGRAG